MATTETMFTIPVVRGISTTPAGGDTAQTLVGSDSGMIFITHNTSNITYTLPSLVNGKGKIFWFMNGNTTSTLTITAPTTSMIANNLVTATSSTCIADAGLWAMVVCDGTNYFCFSSGPTVATAQSWTAS